MSDAAKEAVRALDEGLASKIDANAYPVTWTNDKTPKLILPDVPVPDNPAGLAAWLTSVLRLDARHPVTGAVHQGLRGAEGHAKISRAEAPSIRFEPAGAVNTARRLLPILSWQLLPTDGEPYGFKDEHARKIAHVLRLLCGISAELTEAQETIGVLGTFLSGAHVVEGHTIYGTGSERYQAAIAIQREEDERTGRPVGPGRYLIDKSTGELVIRVSDLQEAARRHAGSSLPRGWLDGRMQDLSWERRRVDGRAVDGRTGRHSPHARVTVYIGHPPAAGGDEGEE